MINDLGFLFLCLLFVTAATVTGLMIGYAYGRESMLNEIYGRRRNSILRRAVRRLDDALQSAKIATTNHTDRVQDLEVIQ